MKEYISNNVEETGRIAQEVAKSLQGGEVLALSGNLGAGKTVFVKALAKAMGVEENITSPTFVLMKVYDVEVGKIRRIVHVDCYRLEGQEDLADIGLSDYLAFDNSVVVIEWADKIINLPDSTIKIKIENLEGDKRKIIID
ncbi:tRNA (adenosine(37)-N6)-threonylcarbamoyltransferase complex ATPase subunit type 1 TsaE [Candidatus Parcubacteria bacterium]|jgi:tRNA threonylcarbamoyladenosine biosynthesis protein TsaE|nr:tRNA (adenosine(37)-N6)-threonylcarbamoyltransferase complex ATPase subunit type 1 TsaE [Candidatus Parcubacteria bacterium]